MQAGVTAPDSAKVQTVPDRRAAIRAAVALAGPDDIVLVAGKGHENYQETCGVKSPFDDKLILTEIFAELGK
jgi:UDP-N-acetylmuramoyl-L-alanyl-D-glutamate--2,6-diaminopimelate ligase